MKKPLLYSEYQKLLDTYTKDEVISILKQMENHLPLRKKYVSAYLTANNWLKNNLSHKKDENNRRNNPIDNIDRAREQAIRESMELIRKAEERNT